jgi:hypothetical protein
MKFLVTALITLVATSAFAKAQEGYGVGNPALFSARMIYLALNVQPVAGSAFESWWNEKSVGGLVCRETRTPFPTATPVYGCEMDSQNENDGEIYEALNVKPVAINPGITGFGAMAKTVGTLTCTRRQVIYPGAPVAYACTLK